MVRKIIQPWWIRKQIALTVARLPSWGLRCCRPKEPLSEPRRGEFRRRAANRRANRTGNAACQEIVFESLWRDYFTKSLLIHHLEHVKLQIIGLFCRPQNRVIRCLCSVFHLAQSLMCASGSLTDCFGKQFIFHKMGTGTGQLVKLKVKNNRIIKRLRNLIAIWNKNGYHSVVNVHRFSCGCEQ